MASRKGIDVEYLIEVEIHISLTSCNLYLYDEYSIQHAMFFEYVDVNVNS
jgi:hypothetical protein